MKVRGVGQLFQHEVSDVGPGDLPLDFRTLPAMESEREGR
jgi:hypothetical protein